MGPPTRRSRRGQVSLRTSARLGLLLWACALACLAGPASPAQAASLGEGLARALEGPVPPQGIRIGVVLQRDDLPPPGLARRAGIHARQQRVFGGLAPGTFRLTRRYESVSGFAGFAQRAAIEALLRHAEVERVYLDGTVYAQLAEGVPLTGADATEALGFTGAGVRVAVLDSGIDTDHPLLQDDLFDEVCFCDDHPSGQQGCCPDGSPTQSGPGAAEDDNGHGSSVAGIITSARSTAPGAAPRAEIVAMKVLNSALASSFSDVAAALDWVLTNHEAKGIRVVNLSLGDRLEYNSPSVSPCSGSNVANAIQALHGAGLPVFAASGNQAFDDGISFPGCVAEAISVGGVYDAPLGTVPWCTDGSCGSILCTDESTAADDFVCHTNSDEVLDILAPNWRTWTSTVGGGNTNFGGTSASSAYAAAQAAILLEAVPALTPDEILTLLKTHGPPVTNPDNGLVFTRSDVGLALSAVLDTDGDGWGDVEDNCPFEPNAGQADTNGDGIGNACQCGDVDLDGFVDGDDVALLRSHLANPIGVPLSAPALAKCVVFGESGTCDTLQAAVLARGVAQPGLPPGIAQVCTAAVVS